MAGLHYNPHAIFRLEAQQKKVFRLRGLVLSPEADAHEGYSFAELWVESACVFR
jgi:hypothetical protein